MYKSLFTIFLICVICFSQIIAQPSKGAAITTGTHANDVTIGKPVMIPYSRVFPLLDGLFRDVSAIQLSQLNTLSPNAVNASRLDSLIQQFQASLEYSQTMGIQNAGLAKQSEAYAQSMVFESQLISQQTQLQGMLIPAMQKAALAKTALQNLPADATPEQKAAAQQEVNAANSNVDLINTQVATLNGMRAKTLANPTTNFVVPTPTPITFPSPQVAPSVPPIPSPDDKTALPSFPASKQMENQIFLLWERLANVVNTLAQADNPGDIYLVKFETGINAGQDTRKKMVLSTQYWLGCKTGNEEALVLDMFPRIGAVNVADENYRDSKFGLSAILNFFSIGGNAAYTRERLRISRTLSQSSYVTGFGVQTNSFGWVFRPAVGEESPSPGSRTTYALVAFPQDCKPQAKLINADWNKAPLTVSTLPADDGLQAFDLENNKKPFECVDKKDCIEKISYSSVEYTGSGSSGTAPVVTIDLKLRGINLDREQVVSVNGNLLKRARDTYGRGTPQPSPDPKSTSGFFQTDALEVNSWFPVSNNEMILTLNPAQFPNQFPRILLNSPKGSIDVSYSLQDAELVVNGADFDCSGAPCAGKLPPIGYSSATSKRFFAARRIIKSVRGTGQRNYIVFKIDESVLESPKTAATNSDVQVTRSSGSDLWSSRVRVIATSDSKSYPLDCEPKGEYLQCASLFTPEFDPLQRATYEIFDPEYKTGAVKGIKMLQECVNNDSSSPETCSDPLIWNKQRLEWNQQNKVWELAFELVNVENGWTATLLGAVGAPELTNTINCIRPGEPCELIMTIVPEYITAIKPVMNLQIRNGDPDNVSTKIIGTTSKINGLESLMPVIKGAINYEDGVITGENLVYKEMSFGTNSKKTIKITCLSTQCTVDDLAEFKKGSKYMYFVVRPDPKKEEEKEYLPFQVIGSDGKLMPISKSQAITPVETNKNEQPKNNPPVTNGEKTNLIEKVTTNKNN